MSIQSCLTDAIKDRAEQYPDQAALVVDGRVTTYAELDRRSNRTAHGLLSMNEPVGTRIAILAGSNEDFFNIWHGASRAGWVLSPVNARLAAAEVAYVLNDLQARILVVDAAHHELVRSIQDDLHDVRQIFSLDDDQAEWDRWHQWIAQFEAAEVPRTVSADETAIQLYTSGTTGYPKGVELSHSALLHCCRAMMGEQAWEPGQVSLVSAPLFHTAGCAWTQCALQSGGTAVLVPAPTPEVILQALQDYEVTEALLVPAVINMVMHSPACADADLSKLRRILYGASPIPVPVLRQAVDVFGCGFEQGYGLTETVGPAVMLRPEDHHNAKRLKSCGTAVPGMEVRVVDDQMRDMPVGEVGEILIAGPQVMKGYWRRPEDTEKTMAGKWLRSGDAGYFDEDGYLYIHDRIKDMIVSGGENVYPAEVESALAAFEPIKDVAIIGVPDEKWGESVKAVVELEEGAQASQEDIIRFAHTRIADYKCPKSVDFVSAIPRNASGKILKRLLRDPYWAGRDRRVN